MEILRPSEIVDARVLYASRVSRTGSLVMLGLFAAMPFGAHALGGAVLAEMPWVAWLVVGPVLLVVSFLWLVLIDAMWLNVRGSFRSSNWLVKVVPDGVYLNLRSPANFAFPTDSARTAFIRFDEIESAGRVTERRGQGENEHARPFLELRLRHANTDALRDACRAEARIEAPPRTFLLATSRTRCTTRLVFVAEPGVIRVAWTGLAILRAIERDVRIAQPSRTADASEPADAPLDERVVAHLDRGDRHGAIALLRAEAGMTLEQAHSLTADR